MKPDIHSGFFFQVCEILREQHAFNKIQLIIVNNIDSPCFVFASCVGLAHLNG